jgi:penicillin-binding protein 1A
LTNPSKALARRNWILDRMLELRMINAEDHQRARQAPLTAEYHGGAPDTEAPYVAEMARQEVIARYGSDAYTIGLSVYLTVNSALQQAANASLKRGIESYDKRHGYRGPIESLSETELQDVELLRQRLIDIRVPRGYQAAAVLSSDTKEAVLLNEEGSTLSLTPEDIGWAAPFMGRDKRGKKPEHVSDLLSRGEVVLVQPHPAEEGIRWQLGQIPEVQGALVSINPENGAILALTGGYDFSLSHFNRATQAQRQPGSSFKPFIYLAGLENGATAATLINDAPIVFEDKNLEAAWRPVNSSGQFYGPTRLRQALYNSRNLVSIRLLQETGINKTLATVRKFGFTNTAFPKDLSLALGSAGLPPLDIAAGYAMLANGGHFLKPFLIERIENSDGTTIYQATPLTVCTSCEETQPNAAGAPEEPLPGRAPRIADERAVYILHSMMKDVIQKGTGRAARSLERTDLAGKTGTTNDQKDAWFSGFNTRIATTTWIGFDTPETLGRQEYGARAALPIWVDFMAVALKDMPESHMRRPDGIVTVRINPETGQLASPNDPDAIFELFRSELAPKANSSQTPNKAGVISTEPILQPQDIF